MLASENQDEKIKLGCLSIADEENNLNTKKGVCVIWRNLSVTAEHRQHNLFKKNKKTYKQIIHNVTGAIFPGTLVAFMGASGSGKTTLMSVLANQNSGRLQIEGDIKINGRSNGKVLKRKTGYVYQDDLFIPTLTIKEHLNFAAKLRLDKNIGENDRNELIEKILREVGLLESANRFIGSSSSGGKMYLSGGERKRLSVATELLTGPQLLFCDEPTTGLDSFSSYKLITMMRNLVSNSYKTIVCSIHQPNRQTFEIFQQIVLLSDGHIVFNGSTADAIQFFEGLGYPYDETQNPAEYLISNITDKRKMESVEHCKSTLHDDYLRSEHFQNIRKYLDKTMEQKNALELIPNKTCPPSWIDKMQIVMHRSFINMARTPHQNTILIVSLLTAIVIGACLFNSVKNTQHGVKAFAGVACVLLTDNFFNACVSAFTCIPDQMPLFFREYSNNSVPPSAFYLCNIIALLSRLLTVFFPGTAIVYLSACLHTTYFAAMMSLVVNVLLIITSATLGVAFSIVFQNESLAYLYSNALLNFCVTCSGIFVKLSSLPFLISWIRYISLVTYACSAFFIVNFKNIHHIECDANSDVPCLKNGLEVLQNYNFDKDSLCSDIIMMLVLFFAFNMIAYFWLLYRIKNRII